MGSKTTKLLLLDSLLQESRFKEATEQLVEVLKDDGRESVAKPPVI